MFVSIRLKLTLYKSVFHHYNEITKATYFMNRKAFFAPCSRLRGMELCLLGFWLYYMFVHCKTLHSRLCLHLRPEAERQTSTFIVNSLL